MSILPAQGEITHCGAGVGYRCIVLADTIDTGLGQGATPDVISECIEPEGAAKLGSVLCAGCGVRSRVEAYFADTIEPAKL